jgi:alpha-amylase/alpha-mannosidase (GH57 family)
MTTALVIHGHFYQPPRENPWTDLVEREPGAEPFHDWNERIHSECYRPNGYARVVDSHGRVERIVNNYSNLSFNFGPTLLQWLERHHPETYARLVEADRQSVLARGGHGNAIAQGYSHAILPLCNERDRRTQIRWGVTDFRLRFHREPESLWLPETACNHQTLDALIEEGLSYVILSPYQAGRVRPLAAAGRKGDVDKDSGDGAGETRSRPEPGGDGAGAGLSQGAAEGWRSVEGGAVDTAEPYKYLHRDGSGRSIAVFFYDGLVARAIAFEGLLASSRALVERCAQAAAGSARLVNVATDGESYGHHFKWGDRCVAYALETEAARRGLRVTNYGEFLAGNEPRWEVELNEGPGGEGTAWSCSHGVGRWARDCGCHAGAPEGWNQRWRTPLRAALDLLRDDAAEKYEEEGRGLFRAPWEARDDYVSLLSDRAASREEFLRRHCGRTLSRDEEVRALTLLEMQRCSMTTYTSCGWFFNDISGIETVQVLRYAGRVVELMQDLSLDPPVSRLLEVLSEAQSNLAEKGTGADIFLRAVEQSRVTPQRVAAHLAITNLVERDETFECETLGYSHQKTDFRRRRHGRVTLETGRLALESQATGARHEFALAAMHFGEIDYYCALSPFAGEAAFERAAAKLWSQLPTASLPALLRTALAEFGPGEFGIEALLPQGQGRLSESVFGRLVGRFMDEYERLYEENRRVVERLQEIGFHPPRELRAAAELTIGRRLEAELQRQKVGAGDYTLAVEIAGEAARHGYRIERGPVNKLFERRLNEAARLVVESSGPQVFTAARDLLSLGQRLGLEANLERAQETVYKAVHSGGPVSASLREFALALGLAPNALPQVEDEPTAAAGSSAPSPPEARTTAEEVSPVGGD